MTDSPTVSVLIPCYNAEHFVAEAIDSALNQTYPRVQVVVVDDGSTDKSVDILRGYGDRIVWETGPNRGGSAARNRALQLSAGQFIQFLDADDVLEPAKLEKQLPPLLEDRADIVLCKLGLFGDGKEPRPEKRPHPAPPPPPEGDPFLYFYEYPIGTPAPLHRRSLLEAVGGFRVGLRRGQEYDLHLRLGAAGARLAMVDELLVWVRMHSGQRVSAGGQTSTQFLALLTGVVEAMERGGQMTPRRGKALAQRLMRCASGAFHEGRRDEAAAGFALARRLDKRVRLDERPALRLLRRCLGPMTTERLRAFLRTRRGGVGR